MPAFDLRLADEGHAGEGAPVSPGAKVPSSKKSGTCPRRQRKKAEGRARRLAKRAEDAKALRHARGVLGLSEDDCADDSGVSRTFWRKCEAGKASIEPAMVWAASPNLYLAWQSACLHGTPAPTPGLPLDRWLSRAVQLASGVDDIAGDGRVTPDERPRTAKLGRLCHELGDALLAAGQGEKT